MVMPSEKYFRFRVPPELEQKLEEFFARTKLARVNVGELLLTYFLTEHENAQFEILRKGMARRARLKSDLEGRGNVKR
jgi:hypothetical protein